MVNISIELAGSVTPFKVIKLLFLFRKICPKNPTASTGGRNKEKEKMRKSKKVMVCSQQNRSFTWEIIVIIVVYVILRNSKSL